MAPAETELSAALATLAREIAAEPTTTATAERICRTTLELVPQATAAGISLARHRRTVVNMGATSETVTVGDALQAELRQGPCLDAIWEHEQVHSGYLPTDERWPVWAPEMSQRYGVTSMLCTRMFTSEDTIGALNLYTDTRYVFDQEARATAVLLAAHCAVAVASMQQIESLEVAVDHRTTTGKAIGVLMGRFGLDDDQALSVLRRLSSHTNRKLYDIAVEVVATGNLPPNRPDHQPTRDNQP